jgi:uncharacterized glyoxalase superfamily protein PhnB
MRTINPYLNFAGTTEEAFNLYKSVFGGEFINLTRFKDVREGSNVPDDEKGKIETPMQDMFWGDDFGMCTDRFRVQWMISYNNNQKSDT